MSIIPGAGQRINEDEVNQQKSFEIMPPSKDVKMQWIEASVRGKDGDETYIRVDATAEILEGPNAGRRIWEGWTLAGDGVNTEAANRIFDAVCFAIGSPCRVDHPDKLLNKPFRGDVAVKPGSNGYGPKNVIRQFKPFRAFDGVPSASAANKSGGSMPWKK